jgi:molybdopterin molybdotransferase
MAEPDVSGLLTVQQAIRIIDASPVKPRVARVRLEDAAGLRLAAPLVADRDYPPFDRSLMDGFAVRSADVAAEGASLKVIGEVAAGQWPSQSVAPGEAIAIMTGAPLPGGADGVVPVEDVEKEADSIRILRPGDPRRYVAARGSDCPAGKEVVATGTAIGPAQIAVAATVGAAQVDVYASPRVAVLSTGDELVSVDAQPGPSQIRNSNGPMLIALLRKMGCETTDLGTIPDRPDMLRSALEAGLRHDALFVSGGMSMGTYDYVPRLLQELGVELKITKLRIKPGKPFIFGTRGDSFVFGLPGNPVSAFVCTVRLASRLLTRLAGGAVQEKWLTGRMTVGMPANGPREFYQPAIRTAAAGTISAQSEFAPIIPLGWKGSADLFTLAMANVLLVRGENEPPVPKGTIVRVLEV